MAMRTLLKISRGGQVSVPAVIRKRWNTSTVMIEDNGEFLVLRPAPDDPLDAVMGIFADEVGAGPSLEETRDLEREEHASMERSRHRA